MKRRQFIILTGVGATSAGVMSACGHPENRLIPALIPDEEYVPGVDYWKASTCAMCPAGCGIIVRTREHKANKIEGNPLHPVNRGALCARGQAGLQSLYNPDRIRSPLRRAGERGEGLFEEITWDEAIKELAGKLRDIKSQARTMSVAYYTTRPHTVNSIAAHWFSSVYGPIRLLSLADYNDVATIGGYMQSYYRRGIPTFDIANATYLLSFGARFLETWLSPVMYSLAYGEFRRTTGRARGKFVQVEPRMSLTAANADEWLPAAPDTEDLTALAICQVIIREGLAKAVPSPQLAGALEEYAPEKSSDLTDIPAEKIVRIAREFASSERPLAIAGVGQKGVLRVKPVNLLNALAGNWNRPGGLLLPDEEQLDPFAAMRPNNVGPYGGRVMLNKGGGAWDNTMKVLLVHQANPVFFAPRMLEQIKSFPFIASFSSFMDETTQLADLILPDHTYLESWDIQATTSIKSGAVATITSPVVKPVFNTRQTADVLIALGRELGNPLPFESAEAMVKQAASEVAKTKGSINAETPEDFWKTLVERGVWSREAQTVSEDVGPAIGRLTAEVVSALGYTKSQHIKERDEESASEYPFTLLVYEHATLGFGEQAHLPWLQELPDPMTSVMWGSWVEINPKTAESLGVADGDLVEVRTSHGAVNVPAVVYPAIRPDVIAMPSGQGHTDYGRYARGRGASPWPLGNFFGDENQQMTVRAKVAKVEGGAKLVRFGTSLPEHIESER